MFKICDVTNFEYETLFFDDLAFSTITYINKASHGYYYIDKRWIWYVLEQTLYEMNKCWNKLIKINLIIEIFNFLIMIPFPSNTNPISYFASVLPQFQGRTNLNLSADASHEEFCFTAGARSRHINFRGGDRLRCPRGWYATMRFRISTYTA